MKPKYGALLIALILASIATLLFIMLPPSANLTVAYIFCLVGIVLMEGGFLIANIRNVPASYALLGQTGKFLPVSLVVSVLVLVNERIGIFTLPTVWHVAVQIVLLAVSAIRLVQIFSGAAHINGVEDKAAAKRTAWLELANQVNLLAAREQNADAKAALKKVADALRYSDPRGVAASQEIEGRIEVLLGQAQGESCGTKCNELLLLIQERNMIVKASK